MAHVEISHDEREAASAPLGNNIGQTGRHRWFKALGQQPVLQSEWISGTTGMTVWIDVPTITELPE